MLKDITLGQYFPGNSLAHRLDPRTKLLLTVIYIVALFCAKSFFSYLLIALVLFTGIKVSGVAPRALVRGLKPILFLICFTAVLNLFYTPGETLVSFWIFNITKEGVSTAFFMVLRITMLIMGTFLLTYTTSHRPDRRSGEPAGAAEEDQGARPRAGHDHVHRPALHPHPD